MSGLWVCIHYCCPFLKASRKIQRWQLSLPLWVVWQMSQWLKEWVSTSRFFTSNYYAEFKQVDLCVWINCKCNPFWKLDRIHILGIVVSDYNCQQQDRKGWEGEKKIRASEKQTRGCAFSTFCSNSFANFSSSVSVSICMAPLVTSTFTCIPLSNGGSGGSRGGCSWVGYSSASSFGSGFRAWNNLEPNWPCHFGGNCTSRPTYPKTTSHPNGVQRDRELAIQDLL